MKNVLKIALAVAFVLSTSSLFAQKLGRINTQELLVAMPEAAEMQTNLEAYAKQLDADMETIAVEFNTKLQDFQKNMNSYSEAVRQLKEKELNELQQRSREFEQVAQEDYGKRRGELLAPIIEKAKTAIDKVAKAGGYTVVFDTSTGSMAYFDEATLTDIAPEVRKELGITATPAAPAK